MNQFERGSEWRKWDLHLHGIDTHLNNQFKDIDINKFVKKVKDAGISAVGLTNYFNFSDQDFSLRKKLLEEDIMVFLNLELRLTYTNTNDECLDFHIIFSDSVEKEKINIFLAQLKAKVGANPIPLISIADEKDKDKATVEFENIKNLIHDDNLIESNVLTGFLSRGRGHARSSNMYEELFEYCDFLIHSSDKRANILEDREFWLKNNKPLLNSSDAHYIDDIGKKFTWIKADPTFEGLKQIIYEPEERIYIGEKPPTLRQVEDNRTKYINCLKINQANSNHEGDIWFKDIEIPFNKELVAIIGNKGSGKSGIADILGLVGNSQINRKHFSFLHKDKFLNGKLANKFKAEIIWESGGKSDKLSLGDVKENYKPESVRFIPQNYFEDLTNEIKISKFQEALEKIIFEYIPVDERLEKSNFQELMNYKTSNVSSIIERKQSAVRNINKEIIKLEEKRNLSYSEEINEFCKLIKLEIETKKELLEELPKIIRSDEPKESSQENDKIIKINQDIEHLKTEKIEKEYEKLSTKTTLEKLRQFKVRVKQQHESVIRFINDNNEEAIDFGLEISEILKIEVDYGTIEAKIKHYEEKLETVIEFLESSEAIKEKKTEQNNKSIIYKLDLLFKKLDAETEKLTEEEQKNQQNEQKRKSIAEQITKLEGDPENPQKETLAFYEKEKYFIKHDLINKLKEKRKVRIEITLEIFKLKNAIIEFYNSFKKAVDAKILDNKNLLKDYDIKIDASFNLNTKFYNEFLNYINRRRRGYFSGSEDGENKIKEIIEDEGFESEDKISNLLNTIILKLEKNDCLICDQVKEEKISQFYDYLFSLDYLQPKYELKLADKTINLLSPGERGALLLIFYLMIDKEGIPLIIDQPEDNLDNESVFNMLSKFIKRAKKKRQIIMVTHNPNLAVGADAEQVIHVNIDKPNKNEFSFRSGSIENPDINRKIVQILEGTKPAFDKRKLKYQ